jgi:hypothetical protein
MDICADGNPCTDDDCQLAPSACMFQNNADACTDSDPCTTLEACSGGVCTGTQVDCSSFNDSCNSSGCNPATGQCETNPTNNGGACDDGNPCTAGETCQSGDCQGGSTVDCSLLDGACHVGVCNSGACESQPTNQGGACDDGNPCTTGETCNAGTCQAGSTLDCSSLNGACQVGVCNSGQCESQAANQGGACDDGNACTTGTTCNAGACGGGLPVNCDDGDTCTQDDCSPQSGCVYTEADPIDLLNQLVVTVMSMNIQQGIANSLDAKLDTAIKALDDANTNNEQAAVNALNAFKSHVQAQQGNKITAAQAGQLIAEADGILACL